MDSKIWVGTVYIDGEVPDLYLSYTREGIVTQIAEYCLDNWEDVGGDPPPPTDEEEVLRVYFNDLVGDNMESYSIQVREVE